MSTDNNPPPPTIFSLGYRCSSAGIIKRLGVKSESFPFDWLVSRLPIIEHCTKHGFQEFLNPDNYEHRLTNTHHYPTPDSDPQWICGESIHWNRFYQTQTQTQDFTLDHDIYIQKPLSVPRDAYAHHMLINHKNIKTEEDHNYYKRCVARWQQLLESTNTKIAFYIHPTIYHEQPIEPIANEIERFHHSMSTQTDNYKGIYVVPVRTEYPYPIGNHKQEVIETIRSDLNANYTISVLWTNRDFIDAGEIFMGNCHVETYVVNDYLQKTIQNGGLGA